MRGYMLVLATAFISGFSVFLNKFGVEASEPFVYTFVKNALVACLLLSIILLLGQRKALAGLQRRSCRNLAAIGILGGGIPFLLFFYGLKLTSAAKAAFIHKTMFVWVIPLAFLFLGERLSAKQTLAAAGLIAGSFLLMGAPAFDYGSLFVFLATLMWAGEAVLAKHVLKEVPASLVAFGRMAIGCGVILAFLILTGQAGGILSLTAAQAGWAVIASALLLGYVWTWYHGLALVKAGEAACILALGSAVTTVLSYVYSPAIAVDKAVASALIFACALAIVWLARTRAPAPQVTPNA